MSVGEALPPFTVELTLQRLVMEAGANRDFLPVHIDTEAGRAAGAAEAFANTTLIETMLEAMIRAWAGPGARIRVLDFAMSGFTCAGQTVAAEGRVVAEQVEDGARLVDLEVWIEAGAGNRTVSGTAELEFPAATAIVHDQDEPEPD